MRSTIHNAREQVAGLRAALIEASPEGLEELTPGLEAAAAGLRSVVQQLAREAEESGDSQVREGSPARGIVAGAMRLREAGDEAGLRRELEALAAELRVAGGLIDHGMAFQQGWARMLAVATAGYRPNGEPSPLAAPGTVSLEG
jgi:hypothetical protein